MPGSAIRFPQHRHSAAGFTLVEVLVALLIMAILAGMAWQGVAVIVRSRDNSQAELQRSLLLNTLLAQWEQDLASLQETPVVPALLFDGASLRLTRRAPGGMQVVVWALHSASVLQTEPGAEPPREMVWQRWAGPVVTLRSELQESWLRSQQLQGNETGQLRLIDGLASWQLYFYRGNEWSNAQSSGDRRAGTTFVPTRVEMPSGVRLLLEFAPGQPRQGSLTRDIMLGARP
ncbi:PulJ/GspJ family protein [Piscinibacter sakaiensis]|uniref:PulJ/GspJ family protein n=1 Tax=Piscinibacter sakaiensis TaxID=1547922 RepID=UPI003AB05B48